MFTIDELVKATGARLISRGGSLTVTGISTDTRGIKRGECFLAIKGDRFDGHAFLNTAVASGAACLIVAVGKGSAWVRQHPQRAAGKVAVLEVADTVKALGACASFHRRRFDIPVIAVTGSNGKTTTKEMLASALSARYRVLKNQGTHNNHIGVPQTLLKLDARTQAAVLELGSNHPGEIAYLGAMVGPTIAAVTNIGPSHLEHFKSLPGVFREKYSLMRYLSGARIGVVNADDRFLGPRVARGRSLRPFMLGFGVRDRCDFQADELRMCGGKLTFRVNGRQRFALGTLGEHNVYNALCAIACAALLGVSMRQAARRLALFDFPRGRLNLLRYNEVDFIDDTYNANPFSLQQALRALEQYRAAGKKILVMGDMLELGARTPLFHQQAGEAACRACDVLITVGRNARLSACRAAEKGFDRGSIFMCSSARQATAVLRDKIGLQRGDVVLAKASRGMHLEEILDAFKTSV
ncbi:MAG TPA: UDP-N-acetylmuramoyl-tripeptide--D-alanyl-D-alanine ligase [Candidatus Omnitrophota bacterium]|nr:UDP-N-acetylmuramoyl-tripeptide--D-alanyl-D-alanine ligase [Candidatus Omnitrophota bacterium]HRZ15248.1 UDP-N-acetylmuramoyl-tripeptide--D-alanyl-D-alanine ligase [Candidatus Omnitrophota bacterium]